MKRPLTIIIIGIALATTACFLEIVETGDEAAEESGESGESGESSDTDDAQAICGDGMRHDFEQCEGEDLGGQTCVSVGFLEGTLACSADCSFDVSGCVPAELCGNGVRDPDEECDDPDFAGRDCASFGFEAGALLCTSECVVDTSKCTETG